MVGEIDDCDSVYHETVLICFTTSSLQFRQEGLQMMREGGKATLVIPSDLAYGDAGSGEVSHDCSANLVNILYPLISTLTSPPMH
jgi:hypothetical protein